MFTRVKTAEEIENIKVSGRMLAHVLQVLKNRAERGMTGKDASQIARLELKGLGGKHAFEGYNGFPDVICISVNDTIVHGIPNKVPFENGDLVSFDYGVNYNGMITDSAFTMIIGESTNSQATKLIKTTEQALYAGVDKLKNGVRVGDIAAAIQKVLDHERFGIVRDLVGHGVGHQVHEDPNIPNYGVSDTGPALKSGMTIAIEPMATLGDYHIKIDKDGWGIKTADGSLSAHFEHTVLITDKGHDIITAWD